MSDIAKNPIQKGPIEAGGGEQQSLNNYISNWWNRIRAGDLGSLPIIIGLIVIFAIFGYLSEGIFFRPRNFVNLLLQMSGITAIATGVVFVLLIGEIDLSIAFVGAVGSVAMTLLLREGENDPNWGWFAAIGAAMVITIIIGLIHGLIITRAGVPSFVVTLAGLLAWSGVVLILTTQYSQAGTIVIQNPVVKGIANSFLPQNAIVSYSCEAQWREWYYHVVRQLQSEGIKTPEDIETGADEYVSLRREWNDEVAAFAKHMAYRWSDIAPAEIRSFSFGLLLLKYSK